MPDLSTVLGPLFRAHEDVPGLSVAVLSGGELTTAQLGEGITPATAFQACSISKPVAATVALRLAADGVLDLDADVNTHLTRWKLPASYGWDSVLTIRHLLSHSGALTVHGFPGYAEGEPLPTLTQILDGEKPANTLPVRVDGVPGLAFRYSGGGYTILQALLEDVTGRDFAALAHERVLAPLGMATAGYEPPADLAPAHRGGAPIEGGWHTYPERAAAGLWCSPTDLVRFLTGLRGAAEGSGYLPEGLAVEMLTERVTGMGLGVEIWPDAEGTRFGHTGSNEGYRCVAQASLTGDRAVAVMVNADEGYTLVKETLEAVLAHLDWPHTPHGPGQDGESQEEWGERLSGAYRTDQGAELRISVIDGQPHLHAPGQPPLVFGRAEDGTGVAPYAHAELRFTGDGLVLRQTGTDTVLRRHIR